MIGILGLIFAIVAPFFVYRNARQNGHNPVLWMLLALVAGVGLQLVIPLTIGILLGVIWIRQGYSAEEIQQSIQAPSSIFGVISLILSVTGIFLIMRNVNIVRDLPTTYPTPPEPPDFNQ